MGTPVLTKIDNNTMKTLIQEFYGIDQHQAKKLLDKIDIVKEDIKDILTRSENEFGYKEILRNKYRFFITENEEYMGYGAGLYASFDNRIIYKLS